MNFNQKKIQNDFFWEKKRSDAEKLKVFAYIADSYQDVTSLIFDYLRLSSHRDPEPSLDNTQNNSNHEDYQYISQHTARGKTAEGSMILALNLMKKNRPLPELLPSLLLRFATDIHMGVRVSILRHVREYARYDSKKAWQLYHAAYPHPDLHMWKYGEPFLQDQYDKNFEKVKYYLLQARQQNIDFNGKSWGEVFARSYLKGNLSEKQLCKGLCLLNNSDAWERACELFTKGIIDGKNILPCMKALISIMDEIRFTQEILNHILSVFQHMGTDFIDMALQIAYKFISVFKGSDDNYRLSPFYQWLKGISDKTPLAAVQVCEHLLSRMEKSGLYYRIWQGDKFLDSIISMLHKIKPATPAEIISGFVSLQNKERIHKNV